MDPHFGSDTSKGSGFNLAPETARRLPPNSKSSHRKRRLATTRGFISPSRGASYIITPTNSPSTTFRPIIGSTPANELEPDCQILSPGVIQENPHYLSVPQPTGGREVSVISSNEVSLDWDNYNIPPQFKLTGSGVNSIFNTQTGDIHGISGLEDVGKITLVDTSVSSLSTDSMFYNQNQQGGSSYDQQAQARVLSNMALIVEEMMEDFSADDVRQGNLAEVSRQLEEISKKRMEFRNAVREYKQNFNLDASTIQYLDNSVSSLNTAVEQHAHLVWAKVETLQAGSNSDNVQHSSARVNQRMHRSNTGPIDDTEYKRKLYRDQLLYHRESLFLPDNDDSISECWKVKTDAEVCTAMHEINNWHKSIERLSKAFRLYEEAARLSHRECDPGFLSDAEDFEDIRNKTKEVILAVKTEDSERNLQSLLPIKSEKVKYPSFSGEVGEDLFKFKNKMIECFHKNRVPRSDMTDKLRENLKGGALKRVPETVKDIDVAWKNLIEAFGSPMVVLKERLKSLAKLGNVPPDSLPSKQIIWYHDFESIIQDIIDLGTTEDLNLQMGAFGPPVQEMILKALSDNPLKKRDVAKAGHGMQPRAKMLAFRDKIIEYRKDTQLAEVESGTANEKDKRTSRPANTSSNVNIAEATRVGDCRICKEVQSQGSMHQENLFEDHLGPATFQCPIFMKLKMKERIQIIKKARMCQYCLDYQTVTDRTHENTCKNKKTNTSHFWKCESPGCGRHSWVCLTHADNSNKNKLKKYAEKFAKRGLEFATIGILSLTVTSPEKSAAYEDLEKQLNKELVPTPDGQPMFLFFSAKGNTRPLKIFFDNGCSRFIMRDCIPNHELPASLVKKGRFPIGGVGGCLVFAENEYMVAMDTVDGKAQQLQGVTVKSITSDFPELDISAAAMEVIANAPQNLQLRRCKFPKTVGGKIDCLIGIQYNQLQPVLLHMLPSGLAIYKTKLAPHIPGQRYVIGGSHTSFDAILSRVGDADHMMEHFIAGLASWRTLGPPSLTKFVMSDKEVTTAMEKNLLDDDMEDFQHLIEIEHSEYLEKTVQDGIEDQDKVHTAAVSCNVCGEEIMVEDSALYLEDERLARLKHILDSQEHGIDISYRCIRCRNCNDCQNAEKIDKISLREEAELYEIKKSYNLDWANGVITCTLPLRGKERDFLSSNEDRALKILNAQCKRYYNDVETRTAIIQAFQKLIDSGFIVFIDDMSEQLKQCFLEKEVQYVLPWRVQFKLGSASTPIRPVFDASSSTKKRQDGTAGRCLNDMVCKGPIDTLDLFKVVLRFFIGPVALAGDLTKMYNQFKLLPEQWNLQRILLKDDLNPDSPVRHAVVNTLIYGVKSVAGQTEHALEDIGNHVENEKPLAAKLLKHGRYVDNLLDSTISVERAKQIASEAEEVLGRLNLHTKGFSFSGQPPEAQETIDGISIDVNAMKWFTETDLIEVKVPALHFGNTCRGRIVTDRYFEEGGTLAKMDTFVPKALTRRMIVSKRASLYDALGKLEPIKAKLKIDEREAVHLTKDWDDTVPPETRNKWVKNFLLMEQLRGIRFSRARMPKTALDTRMRLITLVDAAENLVMISLYCGFRVKDGGWSNQHLIGKSALANGTIPRNELQALSGGSNLAWIVRKALTDWVEYSIIAGDSEIALKWTTFDSRKLGMWVRNRIVQVRRGTDLEDLYYVGTDYNVADVGTRPEKISITDVGPDSRYENGDDWMKLDTSDAVEQGYLRRALDMRSIPEDKEEEFKKEFLLEKEPEILTRGHLAAGDYSQPTKRLEKIAERAAFCNYGLLLPTRRNFPAMVRVASYALAFIEKCRIRVNVKCQRNIQWKGKLLAKSDVHFTSFPVSTLEQDLGTYKMGVSVKITNSADSSSTLHCLFSEGLSSNARETFYKVNSSSHNSLPTDRFLNMALLYYYRQASREIVKFNNKNIVERKTILKDGVLLSKGRILDIYIGNIFKSAKVLFLKSNC